MESSSSGRIVIADMEAGAGTLTRMPQGSLDFALLIVEPSAKSIDVGRRAMQIIAERQIGLCLIVANRVRDAADFELVRRRFPGLEIVAVPEDAIVSQADREARSPVDVSPGGPAVQAVGGLAVRLGRWNTPAQEAHALPMAATDR